jgi:acetyl esterase/lipase
VTRNNKWAWIVAIVGSVALIAGVWGLANWLVDPGDPSAFYDAPQPLPDGPPGTLIRSEPIAGARDDATVYRILYASTGLGDEPIAVSGVVVVPRPKPGANAPIVAWAHGTSGIAPHCAPSMEVAGNTRRLPELDQLVAAGAIVTATDYPGLGSESGGPHPYLVGESEGRAVLDSVRAAQQLVGNEDDAKVAICGHSQGGHATLFAAQLAPDYAPELDIVGVAAMAPPTDLAQLTLDDEGEAPGVILTSMAIQSWSEVYRDTPATAVVKPWYLPAVANIANRCIETNTQSLAVLPSVWILRDRFLKGDPVDVPQWKPHFVANSPSAVIDNVPVFIAQGDVDQIVHPDVTVDYVKKLCAAGATIEFETYKDVGHFEVRTTSAPDVSSWMLDRLAGKPAAAGCTGNPGQPSP